MRGRGHVHWQNRNNLKGEIQDLKNELHSFKSSITQPNKQHTTMTYRYPSSNYPISTSNNNIHPICYDSRIKNDSLSIFNRDKANHKRTLFIYTDSFEGYSDVDISGDNKHLSVKPFRRDLTDEDSITEEERQDEAKGYYKNVKMYSLGIPTYIEEDSIQKSSGNNIESTLYSYKNTGDFLLSQDSETNYTDRDFNKLFEESLQNIYNYILKNKITDVYYNAISCDPNSKNFPTLKFKQEGNWITNNKKNIDKQITNLFRTLENKGYVLNNDNGDPNLQLQQQYQQQQYQQQQYQQQYQQQQGFPSQFIFDADKGSRDMTALSNYTIKDDLLVDNKGKPINIKSGTHFYDDDGRQITLSTTTFKIQDGKTARITSDGNVFIDPTISNNSPIRSIIKSMETLNSTTNQYANNIKIITDNTKKINDILNDIVKPGSNFMILTQDVQDLSQLLIKLKYIEPKVINVQLDAPTPLAKQYSWILKPVELIKSETHALKGTTTLDKLIRENAEMQKIYSKNAYISDDEIKRMVDLLEVGNYITGENGDKLDKIMSNDNNRTRLISSIEYKYKNDNSMMCRIFDNINYPRIMDPIKNKNNCRGKGKGRGQDRGGYGNRGNMGNRGNRRGYGNYGNYSNYSNYS